MKVPLYLSKPVRQRQHSSKLDLELTLRSCHLFYFSETVSIYSKPQILSIPIFTIFHIRIDDVL